MLGMINSILHRLIVGRNQLHSLPDGGRRASPETYRRYNQRLVMINGIYHAKYSVRNSLD